MIQPIVLAAGMGTRMGAIKALIPIDGTPALAIVLRTIEKAGLQAPVVVLGKDAAEICRNVELSGCTIVVNPHPESGMSQSLRLGLEAIDEMATGILTFHVDMPFLSPHTIRAVMQSVESATRMAAPFHDDKRGFPVYFARGVLPFLADSLSGDRGGRQFLRRHSSALCRVAVNDPGCVFDIDQPSDLKAWKGDPLCAINE